MKAEKKEDSKALNLEEKELIIMSLDSTIAGISGALGKTEPKERAQLRALIKRHQRVQDKLIGE